MKDALIKLIEGISDPGKLEYLYYFVMRYLGRF